MTAADGIPQMAPMPSPEGFDPRQMQTMQAMMPAGAGGVQPGPDGNLQAPQLDPSMAQAYMQMLQYFQQGLQQQTLASAGAPPPMPSMPFPGMAPYAAPPVPMEASINVSVDGMKFQYQLTDDDLHKVFSRYGRVTNIRVDDAGSSAVIVFHSIQDAQSAMNDLNGKVLNGLEGTLRISWSNPATVPPYPAMPFANWNFPPTAPSTPWPSGDGGVNSLPSAESNAPGGGLVDKHPHVKGVRKYTCRFLIGIENDKEFQVARRIIGAKGANMKRIVRQTEAKLRLRGMGSGYFEGAGQKESNEPLQLCVSCTSAEGYKTSVRLVEELLKRVYEEFRQFCRDAGKPVPDLQINLSENQLVYSSKTPSVGPLDGLGGMQGGVLGAGSPGLPGQASPKDKQKPRGRRSRTAKGDGKSSGGEVDRGEPGPNAPSVEEIERFIDERNEARRACNFAEADRIRELLHGRGVALMDEPGGRGRGAEVTTWRYWRD